MSSFEHNASVHDAPLAHQKAYDLGYIHGDISDGNVMIHPVVIWDEDTQQWVARRHALLIDWELAERTADRAGSPRRLDRAVSSELVND